MAIAILLGVIAGVVGFVPLVIGLNLVHRHPEEGNFGPMSKLLLGLVASFLLLVVFAVLFVAFDKGNALPFVLSEAAALSVSAIVFGIRSQQLRKKK